ncbi:DUF1648 domain-containing protein [Tsukamurella paurometabola]|uniref:DUF1648 domain-containing protein n=1 Tax=Tsukamurella paurometabola TaxID=2061 RepID=A0A3P8MF30_TSUPA|nr:DUF1648 domain-containing protein [Tsukamurella paurometabola]MBS4103979.1 DUF1648 domain-containing protein [Tsukamurella paurometabola]UEA84221.1 DUF1648 domain-containing protein [Tsukamurella paurometabola]VDR41393.1 Predicted membrane protein [Tsukamurella paurometabola]
MRARWWSFLGTVVAYAAAAAWAAVSGPDPFPTHFGLSGQPDSWTPRSEAVPLHAGIAAGVAVLFAALALAAPRIPASIVNTPRRDYWLSPAHRPAFDDIVSGFLLWAGGLFLVLQGATFVVTIIDPTETAAKSTLVILFLVALVGSIGYLIWLLTHPPKRSSTASRGVHQGRTGSHSPR